MATYGSYKAQHERMRRGGEYNLQRMETRHVVETRTVDVSRDKTESSEPTYSAQVPVPVHQRFELREDSIRVECERQRRRRRPAALLAVRQRRATGSDAYERQSE